MITPNQFKEKLGQSRKVFLSPQEFAMRHRVGGAATEKSSGVLPPLAHKPSPILQTAGAVGREVAAGTAGLVKDLSRSGPFLIPQTALALGTGIMGFADKAATQAFEMVKQLATEGKIDPLAAKAVGDLRESFWHYEPTDPGAQVALKFVSAIPAGVKMAFDVAADAAEKAGWSVNTVAGLRTAGDLAELGAFGKVFHSLRLKALKEQINHPDVDMEAHFRSETVRQLDAGKKTPPPAPLLKSRTGVYKGEKPKSAEELGIKPEKRPEITPTKPSPGQPKFSGMTPEQFRKGLGEKTKKKEPSRLEKLVASELPEVGKKELPPIRKGEGRALKSGITQAEFLARMKEEGKVPDIPAEGVAKKLGIKYNGYWKDIDKHLWTDLTKGQESSFASKSLDLAEVRGRLEKTRGAYEPVDKIQPKPIGKLVPKAEYPFQPKPVGEMAPLKKTKIGLLKASKKRVSEISSRKIQSPTKFKESAAGIKEMERGRQSYYDMLEYQQEVGRLPKEKLKTVEDLARKLDEDPGVELYSGLPIHLLKEDALALARGLKKLKTKADEKGIPFKDYLTGTVGFKPDVADKMMVVYQEKKYDLIPAEMEKTAKAILKKPQTRRQFGRLMLNLVKSQLLMPAVKGKAAKVVAKKVLTPSVLPKIKFSPLEMTMAGELNDFTLSELTGLRKTNPALYFEELAYGNLFGEASPVLENLGYKIKYQELGKIIPNLAKKIDRDYTAKGVFFGPRDTKVPTEVEGALSLKKIDKDIDLVSRADEILDEKTSYGKKSEKELIGEWGQDAYNYYKKYLEGQGDDAVFDYNNSHVIDSLLVIRNIVEQRLGKKPRTVIDMLKDERGSIEIGFGKDKKLIDRSIGFFGTKSPHSYGGSYIFQDGTLLKMKGEHIDIELLSGKKRLTTTEYELEDSIILNFQKKTGSVRSYSIEAEFGFEIVGPVSRAQYRSMQLIEKQKEGRLMLLDVRKPDGSYSRLPEFSDMAKLPSFKEFSNILSKALPLGTIRKLGQEGAISFGGRNKKAEDMARSVKAQRDRMLTPVAGNPLDIISTRFLKTEKIEDYIKLMPALGELKPNELFKIAPELRGKIAAVGKKKSPAIRASGFLTLKNFSDSIKKFKDVSKRDVMWADPTRGMQAIDQGQFAGPIQKHILWPARASMLAKLRWVDLQKHRMLGIVEKYHINSKRKSRAVGDMMEYVGRDDINKTPAEILKRFKPTKVAKKYHGDIVRAAQETRKIYDDLIQWQNAIRKKRGQKEIPYLEKYRKWVIKSNLWNKYLNLQTKPRHVMEHPEMPDFILPNKPFVAHELARTGGLAKYPKERNIVRLTSDYIESAARDIFDTNVVHHNKIHSKVLKGRGLKNAAEFIDRWTAEVFAGVSPRITRAARETIPPTPRAAVLAIRRNLTRAVFPLNWTWNMFIQTSSSGLTYTRYGGMNSLKGLRGFVDPKFRKQIAANAYSHIIKSHRGGSPISQDLATSLLRMEKLDATKVERAEAFVNIFTNIVEEALTRHAVGAAYYHGKKLGLEGRALWEYASEGGAKTQSMYNYQDIPGILRSKETGAVSPFQTFSIEVFNTVREMNVPVLKKLIGKTGAYETIAASSKQGKALASKRLGMIARWAAAMLVTNAVVDKAIGRKPWEISSFVPFLSLIIGGYSARGPVQQQYFQGWVKGVRSVYLYGNFRPLRKWFLHYHVPAGIQMERMVSGITAVIEGDVKDASGKTQFKVRGFEEQLKAISGGVYRTEAGKAYVKKRRETQGIRGVIKLKNKKKKPIGGLK